jgi:hypothetical protein
VDPRGPGPLIPLSSPEGRGLRRESLSPMRLVSNSAREVSSSHTSLPSGRMKRKVTVAGTVSEQNATHLARPLRCRRFAARQLRLGWPVREASHPAGLRTAGSHEDQVGRGRTSAWPLHQPFSHELPQLPDLLLRAVQPTVHVPHDDPARAAKAREERPRHIHAGADGCGSDARRPRGCLQATPADQHRPRSAAPDSGQMPRAPSGAPVPRPHNRRTKLRACGSRRSGRCGHCVARSMPLWPPIGVEWLIEPWIAELRPEADRAKYRQTTPAAPSIVRAKPAAPWLRHRSVQSLR